MTEEQKFKLVQEIAPLLEGYNVADAASVLCDLLCFPILHLKNNEQKTEYKIRILELLDLTFQHMEKLNENKS